MWGEGELVCREALVEVMQQRGEELHNGPRTATEAIDEALEFDAVLVSRMDLH